MTMAPGESHCEHFKGVQVVYWKKGVAASKSTADRAVLESWIPGFGTTAVIEYEMPGDIHLLDGMVRAFERAFEQGREDKAEELRKALGWSQR